MIDMLAEVSSLPTLTNPSEVKSTRLDLAKFPSHGRGERAAICSSFRAGGPLRSFAVSLASLERHKKALVR